MKHVINRIKRLEGQLVKVREQMSEGASCDEVVPQLLATKGALDAVVRQYLSDSLQQCSLGKDGASAKQLIKMITKHL